MRTVDNVRLVLFFRIGEAFSESIDIDHHDLNVRTGGKVSYVGKLAGVIDKGIKRHIFIELFKMLGSNL